ncbi:MAG: galM [Symbiobacteriaceae bacterium]|jgi:aldose 1-epimerase|nr:galM [Symbiobacteriaceae bacterium]
MYTVEETSWSGVPVIRLADADAGTAALVAPSLGGNLFSLTDGDRELLRRPPDADALRVKPTRWGIPVLLPPGRITEGRFQFAGRAYQLEIREGANYHIHGFLLKRAWRVVDQGDAGGARVTLEFRAADYPEVLAQFPHPFVFSLTYTLKGRGLHCESRITNLGETPMPFGVGFHHYFAAPDDGTGRYEIRVNGASRQWEIIDDIPTGRFYEPAGLEDLRSWQPLHAMKRDAGYAVKQPDPRGWSRAELIDRRGGLAITVSASREYGHWVIFNGHPGTGFEDFVCLEPYTCMSNAFNLDLPAVESGVRTINARESSPVGEWVTSWSY